MTLIINYCKLGGLKQHTFISYNSGGQKSKISFTGLKSRCQQNSVSSGGSRGQCVSLSFPALRDHLHFLSHWPHITPTSASFLMTPSLTLTSLPLSQINPCAYITDDGPG